jgi:Activator of Hsp90 ATPase homolog 1-like protein
MTVRWPERYLPNKTKVHVHNELAMPGVQPQVIWAWLIQAELWPTWYNNSENVKVEGGGPDLKLGSKFRWKTFGINLESEVKEFEPYERLAWDAHASGIDACHAWLIEVVPDGCHVITEENQNGWIASLNHMFRPENMQKYHQIWLEQLYAKGKSGPPPTA